MKIKSLILAALLAMAAGNLSAQSALTTMRLTFNCRSASALSAAGQAVIYCDSDDNKMWVSINGAAFVELGSGSGGAGTVTSVALAVPAEFTVSGSPVITSGTLTMTKATQVANRIYAGPASGADAAPTFRLLVSGDLPTHAHSAADVTSGTLPIARGGTGLSTFGTANQVLGMNNAATALEYKTLVPGTNMTIAHAANSVTFTAAGGGGSSLPVVDTTSVVEGSVDATKELRFEVDGLATATTVVATPPTANFTMASLDLLQTFSARQLITVAAGLNHALRVTNSDGSQALEAVGNGASATHAVHAEQNSTSTLSAAVRARGNDGYGILALSSATSTRPTVYVDTGADAANGAAFTVGTADTTGFLVDKEGDASIPLGLVATPSLIFGTDTNTGIWSPGADTFALSTAGVERMRIDSAGKVGIGGTPISDKLEVSSVGTAASVAIKVNTALDTYAQYLLYENHALKWNIFNNFSDDYLSFGTSGGTQVKISPAGAIFSHARSVADGYPSYQSFNAANFTANGFMTWTVEAADSPANTYYSSVVGKMLTLGFYLSNTSVGGTPNTELRIAIPGGYLAATSTVSTTYAYEDAGAARTVGQIITSAGAGYIQLYKINASNWTASTNTTSVFGQVTFPIQ